MILWAGMTKTGKRRNAILSGRTVAARASVPHLTRRVFLTDKGHRYADRNREHRGQIEIAPDRAMQRTGFDPKQRRTQPMHMWAERHIAPNAARSS